MKHLIIGAGAAGITAAKTIRELSPNDEIVLLSADEHVYSRCLLHHYISTHRSVAELSFVPADFFSENNIRWLSGVSVTGVDTASKQVSYDGGAEPYDRLLIATGAQSAIPPIPGIKGTAGVYGFRDLPDAQAIAQGAGSAQNIVIIGAGLVGIDAAYGLVGMGKKPTVVELADDILYANLDSGAAEAYRTKFEEAGCVFRLGTKVASVQSDSSGSVCEVTLEGGESLPCDLLIVATSITPNAAWLEGSGVSVERGVVVDEFLMTSAEDVYAAGDVTGLAGTWPEAMSQGEVAARNMLGLRTVYSDGEPTRCTMNFFGIPTLSIGEFKGADGDTVVSRSSKSQYEKMVLRGDVPVGVILQGDISRSGHWHHIIKHKISTKSIDKPIWKISFADAYSLDESGEYKWEL